MTNTNAETVAAMKKEVDSWVAWVDDLPLPEFEQGLYDLQEYLYFLSAENTRLRKFEAGWAEAEGKLSDATETINRLTQERDAALTRVAELEAQEI